MTRVLVLPKWYPWPDRPVFGLFCREHARAAALHNDVRVLAFTPEKMRGLYRFWEDPAEPVRTTRLVYKRPLLRPAAMATQLLGMHAALRGYRPDVIHAHVFEAGFPAVLLGRRLGVPVVVSEHFTAFQRGLVTGLDLRLARFTFRHADLVCPVSEDLRAQLERVEPRGRYRVVGNVVDPAIFFPPRGARAPRAAAAAQRRDARREEAPHGPARRVRRVDASTRRSTSPARASSTRSSSAARTSSGWVSG